jgi:uncharacterized protein (TIGR04141 family)
VFLLKEGLVRTAMVRDPDSLQAHVIKSLDPVDQSLYVKPSSVSKPRWVSLLQPHVSGGLEGLLNSSTSAVLLVTTHGRTFALSFGHGRHLIEPDAVVQDFGLKVVLNTVAYNQIKSVDARTVDELTLHTRRDVSRDSSFASFGLDVATDLVKAVTGTTTREGLAGRVTGADSLALNSRAQVPELPGLCQLLLTAYGETGYREHFDFIDHLRLVKDPGVVGRLDALMVKALQDRDIDNLHLAVPEPLDWVDVAGFRFSSQPHHDDGEPDDDPRISRYLDTRAGNQLTLGRLKRDRVEAVRADDHTSQLQGWTVYRCIVFELELDGELYTLNAGDWYRVSLPFKDQVDAYVRGIPSLSEELPLAVAGADEDAYTKRFVEAVDAIALHGNLMRRSVPDPIELCDALTRGRTFVHIKKRGKSSTLSHLFAQGVTSAELLLESQEFRDEAREAIETVDPSYLDVLSIGRPAAGDLEVGYVVITRGRRTDVPLTLPFFSRVNLRSAVRRLRGYGFRVSATAVAEQ